MLLNTIDKMFEDSRARIDHIEIKIIQGADIKRLKYPSPSFVSTGFCIIKLYTNTGLIGIGEPSPYGGNIEDISKALQRISDKIIKKPIYNTWRINNDNHILFKTSYGGLSEQAVIAALSQCCLDILGKEKQLPAYKILNTESDGTIPAYASGGMIYDYQILDLYVEEALDCKKQGFKAWKFRPSTPKGLDHFQRNNVPPVIDINAVKETIKNVSSEVGKDFEILLDVGCRCKDICEAIELSNFSMDYNVGFIEEPLPRKLSSYQQLIKVAETKISIGETFFSALQFEKWVKSRAIDIFQPDMNLAGMREGIKILSIAQKYNKNIILHNWANPISNLANLHFAVAFKGICNSIENSIVYNPFRELLIKNNPSPIKGIFDISKLPNGLGVDLYE